MIERKMNTVDESCVVLKVINVVDIKPGDMLICLLTHNDYSRSMLQQHENITLDKLIDYNTSCLMFDKRQKTHFVRQAIKSDLIRCSMYLSRHLSTTSCTFKLFVDNSIHYVFASGAYTYCIILDTSGVRHS